LPSGGFWQKKQDEDQKKDQEALTLLQQQLNQVSQTVDVKLAEANRVIQEQFGQSFKIISDVTQKLTQLDNTNKQVIGFAQQLQSLENILKNPKQRGDFRRILPGNCFKKCFAPGRLSNAV